MGFVALGAFAVIFYATERVTARVRRARLQQRRANAAYPINDNDPIGRTVV
jgi:hypothetical protein